MFPYNFHTTNYYNEYIWIIESDIYSEFENLSNEIKSVISRDYTEDEIVKETIYEIS